MEMNLLRVHSESIGYGRFGVRLAEALEALGVDLYDDLPTPQSGAAMSYLQGGRKSKVCNVVCWVSVPSHARGWWEGQTPIVATMWESTYLPESFRESLHEFDTVIVPSEQNQELFGQYHPNVKYVPLGVDPVAWAYQPRKRPGVFFNFLIGGSGTRKGTDLAVKAFKAVFPDGSWGDGPIPQLIMKNPKGEPHLLGDRVTQITGKLTPEDEVALYADAHCYVQPSRGEGFGLQPLQAMAQGCPTILTDAHGHASFAKYGMGIPAALSKSAYFIYGDAGDWWEPDFDALCDHMRWVYDHYDEAQRLANVASWHVHDKFTWADTARGFLDAVGRDRLTVPYAGGGWHELEAKMYRTVTNRDYYCEIGGVGRLFRKGEEYWEPADVKRILFEGDVLDLSCCRWEQTVDGHHVEDDIGLLPEQVARLGKYEARHSFCPTCNQQLNTRPTRFEELIRA